MAKRSPYTQAANNVVGEYLKMRQRPSQAIPFGQERVSKETMAARVAKMGAEERAALIEKVGVDALLVMLK